jgi:hypothetical protein
MFAQPKIKKHAKLKTTKQQKKIGRSLYQTKTKVGFQAFFSVTITKCHNRLAQFMRWKRSDGRHDCRLQSVF